MRTLLSVAAIMCMTIVVHAQWQPDVRLTNQPATSLTPFNYKCVAASGDVVHVVWYDDRDGNFEIHYKRSTDAGTSWGIDTRLTNNGSESSHPSVAIAGASVHVLWQDTRNGNWELYYKRDPTGSPVGADPTGDGLVNGADLAILLAGVGTADAAADLTDDSIVDGADLALLLGAWTG